MLTHRVVLVALLQVRPPLLGQLSHAVQDVTPILFHVAVAQPLHNLHVRLPVASRAKHPDDGHVTG